MYTDFDLLLKLHRPILELLNDNGSSGKENAKLVGGCVRDFLLYGKISNDIDISTVIKPLEVIEILKKYRKNFRETKFTILDRDIAYGTVVAIIDNTRYEITTTRSDIMCFGRQAKVQFCRDFQEDSKRRDFTINALYLGLDGKILDFYNGIDDLKKGVVRFIGDPKKRIEEDFLRIIRFFRFATKFNCFEFDHTVLQTIISMKYGLKNISRERIRSEIFKLLEYKNWFEGLMKIADNDFVEDIFLLKNVEINSKKPVKLFKNKIASLFYFFNYDCNSMNILKDSLRFTRDESDFVDFLILLWRTTNCGIDFNIDAKMLIYYKYRSNKKYVYDAIDIFQNDFLKKVELFLTKIKPLNVDAQSLMNDGFSGKELGNKIRQLEKEWVENDFIQKD